MPARFKPGNDEFGMVSEPRPDSIAIYQAVQRFISANPL
jgi:hypothetical protein